MPYLKQKERHPIESLLNENKLNGRQLAPILGCSESTARRKLKDPDSFTVADLHRMRSHGHIPIARIREAII